MSEKIKTIVGTKLKFEIKVSTVLKIGTGFVFGIASYDFMYNLYNSVRNLF